MSTLAWLLVRTNFVTATKITAWSLVFGLRTRKWIAIMSSIPSHKPCQLNPPNPQLPSKRM